MGGGITAQQRGDLVLCGEDTELDGRDNIAGGQRPGYTGNPFRYSGRIRS